MLKGLLNSCCILGLSLLSGMAAYGAKPIDPQAIEALETEAGSKIELNKATGTLRFVRIQKHLSPLRARPLSEPEKEALVLSFLEKHAGALGLKMPRLELKPAESGYDALGFRHFNFSQIYRGLPVFGTLLRVHLDRTGAISAVNGTTIPDINVDAAPRIDSIFAGQVALQRVQTQKGALMLRAASSQLLIFREGLARGVEGADHLAWEIEITDGIAIREFVFVDARQGTVIDQITGTPDALRRRTFDAEGQDTPGPNYPGNPFWVEGEAFPTSSSEANNLIVSSRETYDFFFKAFDRDSFDGNGATMDAIFNRGDSCPNANWFGTHISFCPGMGVDDVTAHEWSHAYTQYTDGLVYSWQPGALNEAYSDIWGETIDLNNNHGLDDAPDTGMRTSSCSTHSPPRVFLQINTPGNIAGSYSARAASFGPRIVDSGLRSEVVLVDDGEGVSSPPVDSTSGSSSAFDGCQTPFSNRSEINGKIALLYRGGGCSYLTKVKNAQANGAIGVIVANHESGGERFVVMGGVDETIRIPSLFVTYSVGRQIALVSPSPGANVTFSAAQGQNLDNSYRWLFGEENSAPGTGGALRDMWNPDCYDGPGRVGDPDYYCFDDDSGGVHVNCGIPTHAYALLVDGGTFNEQTILGLGFTKAANIYWRAQTVYQVPTSDFADHADALEQSCRDLIGAILKSIDGQISLDVINSFDCIQVEKALAAVEMRNVPTQCQSTAVCVPTVNSDEVCDGIDNDCDGLVDNGADASCDDGNACTADSCSSGACTHVAIKCNDGDPCTKNMCNPNKGCVFVNDGKPAMSDCPEDQVVTASSNSGAVVTFTPPTSIETCSAATVTCEPASGTLFAVGDTTVTCTAKDALDQTTTCAFTVKVAKASGVQGVTNNNVVAQPIVSGCGAMTQSTKPSSDFVVLLSFLMVIRFWQMMRRHNSNRLNR